MRKKLEPFVIAGNNFSSIDASPLGQVLNKLKVKLKAIQSIQSQDRSKEYSYSKKQLEVVAGYIEDIKYLLGHFSEGKAPGLTDFGFGTTAYSLYKAKEESPDFDTPAYAMFRVVKGNLSEAIKKALSQQKIKTITSANIGRFRDALKAELRNGRFTEAAAIPGFNFDVFFVELDRIINNCEFEQFNEKNAINQTEMSTVLSEMLERMLFEKHTKLNEAISSSLRICKINQFTEANKAQFSEVLKAELRKYRDKDLALSAFGQDAMTVDLSQIPDSDCVIGKPPLELLFDEIDEIINQCNFQLCNLKESINTAGINYQITSQLQNTELFNKINNRMRPFKRTEFQITHPVVYDFAIEALELLIIAPKEFKALATFLNATAITSGILPTIIEKIFSVKIENSPSEDSAYRYNIKKEQQDTDTIDIGDLYKEHIGKVRNQFEAALVAYYKNYGETLHVQRELEKADLIKQFITKEEELDWGCRSKANELARSLESKLDDNLTVDARVNALNEKLQVLKNSQEQIASLQKRKASYEEMTVGQLFTGHGLLIPEQLIQAGFNANSFLPEVIVSKGRNESFYLKTVREDLAIEPGHYGTLLDNNDKFTVKIKELQDQLNIEVQSWRQQEIVVHQNQNNAYSQDLEKRVSEAKSLVEKEVPESVDIEQLEKQLAVLAQQSETLSGYLKEVQDLEKIINKPAQCPVQLVELDPSINKAADDCYQSSRAKAKESIRQITVFSQGLEAKKEALELKLKKARKAKELSETMKSADPAAIVKLRDEKQEEYDALLLKIKEHEKELQRKILELENCSKLLFRNQDPLTNLDLLPGMKEMHQQLKETISKRASGLRNELGLLGGFNVTDLFSLESLETSQGALKAKGWWDGKLVELQQLKTTIKDLTIDADTQFITLFTRIRQIIDNSPNVYMPFTQLIEELDEVYDLKYSTSNGFFHLLKLLNDRHHTVKRWKRHRENPNTWEASEDKRLFSNFLQEKIKVLNNVVSTKLMLQDYQDKDEEYQILSTLLSALNGSYSELEQEEERRKVAENSEQVLSEEIPSLKLTIEKESKEAKNLLLCIAILNKIVNLLECNLRISKQIGGIDELLIGFTTADLSSTVNLLNANQTQLTKNIVAVRNQLKELEALLPELEADVGQLEDKSIYPEYVEKIKGLINGSKQKTDQIVQDICTKKRDELVTRYAREVEELKTILAERPEVAEKAAQLIEVNELLPRVIDLKKEVEESLAKKDFLLKDRSMLANEDPLVAEIDNISANLAELSEQVFEQPELFLAKIGTLLEDFSGELSQNQESIEGSQTVAIGYLASFPVGGLNKLQVSLEKLQPASATALEIVPTLKQDFLTQTNTIFTDFNEKLAEHHAKIDSLVTNETKETQGVNDEALNEASSYLNDLPLIDQLSSMQESLEQFNTVSLDPEVPLTNLEEVPSENLGEVLSENLEEVPSENLEEVPSGNLEEVPSENLEEMPSENLGEVSLENLAKIVLDKLARIRLVADQLIPQVGIKTVINSKLANRVGAREQLVKDFKEELLAYHLQRKAKYRVKDQFFSKDCAERELLVAKLGKELDQYANSGDSAPVFAYIGDKKFEGFHLQPIINRLLLAIKELDKTIPDNYEPLPLGEDAVPELANRHDEAWLILTELEKSNPVFATGIRALYEKIGLINQFADSLKEDQKDDKEIATTLAKTLSNQVDRFIIDNKDQLEEQGEPDKKKDLLLAFQTDFVCRLNSQNDVLSKYNSWGPFIANITLAALAIVTVGVTAIVQAIVMKGLLERDSMFFKPGAIEYVDKIDKIVHEIAAPVA